MSAHKQRYKNVGLDSNEMRRRREEEGIQLRKQKREQQLIKRRNVDTEQIMDNEIENTISVRILSYADALSHLVFHFSVLLYSCYGNVFLFRSFFLFCRTLMLNKRISQQ